MHRSIVRAGLCGCLPPPGAVQYFPRSDGSTVHFRVSKPPPKPASLAACLVVTIVSGGAIIATRQLGMNEWWAMPIVLTTALLAAIMVVRLGKRPWNRWEPRWGHHHATACLYLTLALAMLIVTTVMNSAGSLLVRLTTMPGTAGLFIGFAIAALGVVRLTGGRYCSKCRYEMSEAIASDTAQPQCPECGAFWKRPGGTRDDHLTLRWPWIIAGVVIGLMLTLGPLLVSSQVRALPLRVLPTSSLIEEAASGFMTRDEAWGLLMSRQLTAQQETRLARRLLDVRLDRGYLTTVPDTWLQERINAEALPPDLASRYVDEHPHPHVLEARNILPAARSGAAPTTEPDAPDAP